MRERIKVFFMRMGGSGAGGGRGRENVIFFVA